MFRTIERRSRRARLALRAWPLNTGSPDYRLTCGAVPLVLLVFMAGTLLLLAGCGGGGGGSSGSNNPPPPPAPTFTIGGSVTDLNGMGLTLQLNGGRDLAITTAGNFTFSGTLTSGAAYTVTVSAQPASPHQTCTVSNGSGTLAANVSNIAVACTTNAYPVGGSAQGIIGAGLLLQNNDGDNLTINADGAFVFATAVPSGETYEVSIARQPSNPLQACQVTNGSGAVAGAAITNVSIACEAIVPRFAYVTNLADDTVSVFRVEDASGALRHHGYALTGKGPRGLALDPSFRFAYVANQGSGDVSGFGIDSTTGVLTPLAGSPFKAGDAPQSVVVHPSRRFAYVVNQLSDTVSVHRMEASGALSDVGSARTERDPVAMAFDPQGRFAFVANSGSNSVTAYEVSASTGELKLVNGSPFATGKAPQAVEVDPSGRFLYVANHDSKNVSVFAIEATGALTPAPGSPFPSGDGPFAIALDPTGRFAYVSNLHSDDVAMFEIDDRGSLTELRGSPLRVGDRPQGLRVDPSGRYVYVANAGTNMMVSYRIQQDGTLRLPRAVVARDNPGAIAIVAGPSAVRLTPKFAYAVNSATDDVTSLAIDAATGALSRIGMEVPSGEFPTAVMTDPAGRFVYAVNTSADTIATFGIDSTTGVLAPVGALVPTGSGPAAIASDASGRFAFVVNGADDTVETFAMNATTGALTSIGATSALGSLQIPFAVHPSGRFVYTSHESPDTVRTFRVNAQTGALTEVGTGVAIRDEPLAMSIDATGQFLYISADRDSADDYHLTALRLDSSTGIPAEIADLVTDDGMYGAAVDPSGRYLCVTESLSGLAVTRAIDQETGELSSTGALVAVGDAPTRIEFEGSGRFAYVINGGSDSVAALALDPVTGAMTRVGTDAATGRAPAAIAIANELEFE